jgi:hypothetical protein
MEQTDLRTRRTRGLCGSYESLHSMGGDRMPKLPRRSGNADWR